MVPPALAGQEGGREVDMKIKGESERGQLGGGQALSPSSAPPPPHKEEDEHPCLGGSHWTPPLSLVTPCSGQWRETEQPIVRLSFSAAPNWESSECDLPRGRENGKCPSS